MEAQVAGRWLPGGGVPVPHLPGPAAEARGREASPSDGARSSGTSFCPGGVREEGGAGPPRVPALGLGAELPSRRRKEAPRAGLCSGPGVARAGRAPGPIFKAKPMPSGVPALPEPGAGAGCGAARGRRASFPTHPAPPTPAFFLPGAKKSNTSSSVRFGYEGETEPRHPEPTGHMRGAARRRDPAALTPAPARAEKFARPRAPRAPGRPAPGREPGRRRRRVALARPERRGERAPARVRPELARGREPRPPGPGPPLPPSPRRVPASLLPKSEVWGSH